MFDWYFLPTRCVQIRICDLSCWSLTLCLVFCRKCNQVDGCIRDSDLRMYALEDILMLIHSHNIVSSMCLWKWFVSLRLVEAHVLVCDSTYPISPMKNQFISKHTRSAWRSCICFYVAIYFSRFKCAIKQWSMRTIRVELTFCTCFVCNMKIECSTWRTDHAMFTNDK